jgi:aspartate/methionine/tyrosine aminotransferase
MPESSTLRINEDVASRRAEGETIYHMGFGESPFPVPPRIAKALGDAAGSNRYPPTLGLTDLRHKALSYFSNRLGFVADGMTAMVGPGSKDLIFAAQLAIAGDVMLPTPSWVSYAPQARLAGTTAIKIPTQAGNHHAVTGELLQQTISQARAKGLNPRKIILNYPNNPTGLGISQKDLQDIAEVCRDAGVIVISDEIYSLIAHGGSHKSIAGFYPEGTIVTTGLSKHLSLGGYRIGFAFIPDALGGLMAAMRAIASETWSCVSHPVQYAAIAAVEEHGDIEAHIAMCTRIHGLVTNYVRDCIIAAGIEYPPLAGGFYLYPDFTPLATQLAATYGVGSSTDLAADLLSRVALATLPGTDFGDADNVLALRLAVTDYDGAQALELLTSSPDMDPEQFVAAACPRIARACAILTGYFEEAVHGPERQAPETRKQKVRL